MVDVNTVEGPFQSSGSRWSLAQFGLVCLYTVGIHSTFSLPYYVSVHSDIFLVCYYVMLLLVCIPVCYVQIKLGAIYKRGIVGIFSHLIPILKGSAVALLMLTYLRCLVHSLELSYVLSYMFAAFGLSNTTQEFTYAHSASTHFHENFLQRSQDISEGGHLIWYISVSLAITWIFTYFLTFRGFLGYGKVVYILTPILLVTLCVAFIYAFTTGPYDVQNSHSYMIIKMQGMNKTAVIPDINSESRVMSSSQSMFGVLSTSKPWIDALLLHMGGIGLWSGILPSLGAQMFYKKFTINASLGILILVYGLAPLPVIAALRQFFDQESNNGLIAVSVGSLPGLSYVLIGMFRILKEMPIMSMTVYFLIFLCGNMHQAVHLIAIWETLLPSIPTTMMRLLRRREFLIAVVCLLSAILTLPFSCQAGIYVYFIVNSYIDRLVYALVIICIVPFTIGYIKQDYLYLPLERACMCIWFGLASMLPAAILVYYFAVYVYPEPLVGYDQQWAEQLGWVIAITPMSVCLILGAVHSVYKQKGSLKQRCVQALKTDSLRTTDSVNDVSETTTNTGFQTKSPTSEGSLDRCLDRMETEVRMQPEAGSPVVNV